MNKCTQQKKVMIENNSEMLHLNNFPNKERFKQGTLANCRVVRRDYKHHTVRLLVLIGKGGTARKNWQEARFKFAQWALPGDLKLDLLVTWFFLGGGEERII